MKRKETENWGNGELEIKRKLMLSDSPILPLSNSICPITSR